MDFFERREIDLCSPVEYLAKKIDKLEEKAQFFRETISRQTQCLHEKQDGLIEILEKLVEYRKTYNLLTKQESAKENDKQNESAESDTIKQNKN